MTLSPYDLLVALICLTALAYAADRILRRRTRRAVRGLAAAWRMNFGPFDNLRLTPRVAPRFPVPGAAAVVVRNVVYGVVDGYWHYVFTAEFTVGAVGAHRRVVRAAHFTEPRDRTADAGPVVLAPSDMTLLEQYAHLAPRGNDERSEPVPPTL